jgi:hypothetical protein
MGPAAPAGAACAVAAGHGGVTAGLLVGIASILDQPPASTSDALLNDGLHD